MFNFIRSTLEGIESSNEDLGKQQEAFVTGVVFVETANDAGCDEFAEDSTSSVDALCGEAGLGFEEEDAVGEEAVYWATCWSWFFFFWWVGVILPTEISWVSYSRSTRGLTTRAFRFGWRKWSSVYGSSMQVRENEVMIRER